MRDYRFSDLGSGAGRDRQAEDLSEKISTRELDSVAEFVRSNELRGYEELDSNEIAQKYRIASAKVFTILGHLGYQHDWRSSYRLISSEDINSRIAQARRVLLPKEPEVKSTPNPYAGMTLVVDSPATTEGKIEELGKKRATISISTFSKQVNLEPEQLRKMLSDLGWKPYLTPLQIRDKMDPQFSDYYQRPQKTVSNAATEENTNANAKVSRFSIELSQQQEVKLACEILIKLVPEAAVGVARMVENSKVTEALNGLGRSRIDDILTAANLEQGQTYVRYCQDSHQRLTIGMESGELRKMKEARIESTNTPVSSSSWSSWSYR